MLCGHADHINIEKSKNRVISKHASLEELCLDASLNMTIQNTLCG